MFPVSGIAQTGPQELADRYTYVPHLGLAIAVVWGLGDAAFWRRLSGSMQKAVTILVLAGLGALTWMQVGYWRNSASLFTHTLSVTKDNYLIHHSLAIYWELEGNNLEKADASHREAVAIASRDFRMRLSYGIFLMDRLDRPEEALVQLQEAVQMQPNDPDAQYWLGTALAQTGQEQEAQEHWQQSVACWQANAKSEFQGVPHGRQARPHQALAESAMRAGQPRKALPQLTRALEIKKDHVETLQLLGLALGRLERWADAEEALRTAVELQPENASTRGYLASAYARQGKKELAAGEYALILNRFPDWPEKTADFALKKITHARLRDPITAEELAAQICEATDFKDPRWLNTLAAAQAANGAFAKARATAQQALELNPEPAVAAEIRDRLRLYEKNQALPLAKDQE
jgi:Flp pilus assembly protein TadD